MIILNQLQKRFSPSFAKIARVGSERPSKYIYLLIFIFIALFMQAYIHNYNIVYLALFFTFAFSISSYAFGRNNIRALEVQLLSFGRVFANQESHYTLRLSSSKQDLYDIKCISMQAQQHVQIIRTTSPAVLEFSHHHHHRGVALFESVQCESGFPLPHQVFYKVFDIDKKFVIYPEPKGISLEQFLAKDKTLHGETDDFEGIRSFEGSDKLSHIYWPSLAKGDTLMSKQFSYQQESELLHFDFMRCAHEDEARLSQLCLWVLECEQQSRHYSITMGHRVLESKKMGYDEVLTFLGKY